MFDTDGNHRVDKNEFLVVRLVKAHNVSTLLFILLYSILYVVPKNFIYYYTVIQRLNYLNILTEKKNLHTLILIHKLNNRSLTVFLTHSYTSCMFSPFIFVFNCFYF
jgi:hypothetical protein